MNHRLAVCTVGLLITIVGCNSNNGNQQNAIDLPVNITSVLIQGDFSLNNDDFPASQYDHGLISLADGSNNQAVLGDSSDGGYQVRVVAADYNSQYDVIQSTGTVPVNKGNTITDGLSLLSDQGLNINVEASSVRLNGSSFPASEYDDALFYVQRTDGGERVLLGNSHSPIDPVWLMPGTFNVIYEVETPGGMVPLNQNSVVDVVDINSSTSGVNIDITAVPIRLNATLDSNPFAASEYQDGNLSLLTSAGDRADLGSTHDLPFADLYVIEGTYDIVYAHETGDNVPANVQAVIAGNQLIDMGHTDFSPDIKTALLTPQYSHNGNAFPASEYQDANIFLRMSGNPHDLFLLGNTHAPGQVRVIQGNYDLIYQHETGDEVPQNTNAVVAENVPLPGDQVLPVIVNSVEITGIFTLNGNKYPADAFNIAQFDFRGAEPGDDFLLGLSYQGQGTVKLIPGTYDVIYRHVHGNNVPQNPEHAVMSNQLLDTAKTIRINVKANNIKPTFTLNNQPFPKSVYERGRFYLQGKLATDQTPIGESYMDNLPVMVINDHYDVMYQYIQGNTVPVNENKLITDVAIP